jgi:hypothetical protein
MRNFLIAACLLLLFSAAWAADPTPDPASRFIGSWEGPANVYDDYFVMKPTNAKLTIARNAADPKLLVVEMTLFGDKLSRFTRCELVGPGELRIADEVLVEARHVKVEGSLKARGIHLIEEGQISFFVETNGQWRPYYSVKMAVKRIAETTPASAPSPTPASEQIQ